MELFLTRRLNYPLNGHDHRAVLKGGGGVLWEKNVWRQVHVLDHNLIGYAEYSSDQNTLKQSYSQKS